MCQWLLPWSAGAITELTFEMFDLEVSFDYLDVKDYNSGTVVAPQTLPCLPCAIRRKLVLSEPSMP